MVPAKHASAQFPAGERIGGCPLMVTPTAGLGHTLMRLRRAHAGNLPGQG